MKNPGRWLCEQLKAILEAAPVAVDYTPGVSLPMEPGTIEELAKSRLPRWTPETIETLQVALSDRARRTSLAGRDPRKLEITVQMLLMKTIDPETDELENLIELVFAIDQLLAQQTQLGYIESSNEPIYDPKYLEENSVFRSVLTMTFTNIR